MLPETSKDTTKLDGVGEFSGEWKGAGMQSSQPWRLNYSQNNSLWSKGETDASIVSVTLSRCQGT